MAQQETWTVPPPHGHSLDSDEERLRKLEAFMQNILADPALASIFNRSSNVGSGTGLWRVPTTAQSDWIVQDAGGPGVSEQYAKIYGLGTNVPHVTMEAQSSSGNKGLVQASYGLVQMWVQSGGNPVGSIIINAGGLPPVQILRGSNLAFSASSTSIELYNPSGAARVKVQAGHTYVGDTGSSHIDVDDTNDVITLAVTGGLGTTQFIVDETFATVFSGGVSLWSVSSGPVSGQTCMVVRYHNGAAQVSATVSLGAADSGGAGFKLLRVPN